MDTRVAGKLGSDVQKSRYTSESFSLWGKMKKGKKSPGSGRKKLVLDNNKS